MLAPDVVCDPVLRPRASTCPDATNFVEEHGHEYECGGLRNLVRLVGLMRMISKIERDVRVDCAIDDVGARELGRCPERRHVALKSHAVIRWEEDLHRVSTIRSVK